MYAIIGAGLTGATIARLLAEAGISSVVFEKENIVGGLCADDGFVSRYGPHIFHTRSVEVWNFVTRFAKMIPYVHRVVSYTHGKYVPYPVNIDTLKILYGVNTDYEALRILKEETKEQVRDVSDFEVAAIAKFGRTVYEALIKGYTLKQWGRFPGPSVIDRVPLRLDHDDRFFTDKYQGLPYNGYTRMVENMLDHECIGVRLNCAIDCTELESLADHFDCIISSAPPDELLDFRFGTLDYRGLDFEFANSELPDPYTVVNLPDIHIYYTRATDYKKLNHVLGKFIGNMVVYEMPSTNSRMYPVVSNNSRNTWEAYATELSKYNVHLVGRLGSFRYLNMDDAIAEAFAFVRKLLNEN